MTRAQQAGRSSRKEIDMISVELTIFVFLWEAVAKRCNDVDRCAHSSRGCAASIGLDRDSCRAHYPSLGLAETGSGASSRQALQARAARPCVRVVHAGASRIGGTLHRHPAECRGVGRCGVALSTSDRCRCSASSLMHSLPRGDSTHGDASGRARETSSPEGGPEAEARADRGGGPVPWEARDEDARGGSDAPAGPSPVPLRVS